jgi:large subunit ribosomal protein L28
MALKCVICGKTTTIGNAISHSHRRTKRRIKPNLQKISILLKGKKTKATVCTRCIKSKKITKAV